MRYILFLIALTSPVSLLSFENPILNYFDESNIIFIENKGQINSNSATENPILFYSNNSEVACYFAKDAVNFIFSEQYEAQDGYFHTEREKLRFRKFRVKMHFDGANPECVVSSELQRKSFFNYYLEHCKSGINRARTFSKIIYKNVYDNIDIVFYGRENRVKYDIIVKTGGDLNDVKLAFDGIDRIEKLSDGAAKIISKAGTLKKDKPSTYFLDKKERFISQDFVGCDLSVDGNKIAFIAEKYDESKTLVIDPYVGWITYCRGRSVDWVRFISVDGDNNILVSGSSQSDDMPTTPGVFDETHNGNYDQFAFKFDPDGDLIWGTYLGSSGMDHCIVIKPNNKNELWIGGESYTNSYPVTYDAVQTQKSGSSSDQVLTKLSSDGELLYATYYGGNDYEGIADIEIDSWDNLWFTGRTHSGNYPTTNNAYQRYHAGGYDASIGKLSDAGKLLYCTCYGRSADDISEGIAVDSDGNVGISGYTTSKDFQLTPDAFQKYNKASYDAFLIILDSEGGLKYSTFYGGDGNDYGSDLTCDAMDNFIIRGITNSSDLKTKDWVCSPDFNGGIDAFLAKFDKDGQFIWGTYFGGSKLEGIDNIYDQGGGVHTNEIGDIAFSGRTNSEDLPITDNPYQQNFGGDYDSFIAVLKENGKLFWSTYLGGSDYDAGLDVGYNHDDCVMITGLTESKDFPVTDNALQKTASNRQDGFIAKICSHNPAPLCHPSEFDFPAANGRDDFHLSRSASCDGSFVLTPSENNLIGGVWHRSTVPVKNGFTTEFTFRFSHGANGLFDDGSLAGADGIAFLIYFGKDYAIGKQGGRLGYDPIENCLAIEFDTYNNNYDIDNINDPNGNHIAVMCGGKSAVSANHESGSNLALFEDIPIIRSDSTLYYVKIDYNETPNALRIWIDETGEFKDFPYIVSPINLNSLLDLHEGEGAYVGIAAATGVARQRHQIDSWYFCPKPSDYVSGVAELGANFESAFSSVYPNPARDFFTLNYEMKISGFTKIYLTNTLGRVVKNVFAGAISQGKISFSIDLSELSRGVYFCIVETNEKISCKKIIKR